MTSAAAATAISVARSRTSLTALASAVVLTACTTNPYTGEQQASKAATYGAGAAAVCALFGAMDSKKKARNAALGCGIVGAGVGGPQRQLPGPLALAGVQLHPLYRGVDGGLLTAAVYQSIAEGA